MWERRVMAVFIGATMLISIIGFATMRSTLTGKGSKGGGLRFSKIMERALTPEERSIILRSGFTIIEYLYPQNCSTCEEKASMYREFMEDEDFSRYAVLSISPINETEKSVERITGMNGEVVDLNDVVNLDNLERVYCKVALRKPDACVFYEI